MRVLVFFDLPVTTAKNRREYTKFRKFLIKSGFIMEQESVYSKLVPNGAAADAVTNLIRKNKTENGSILVLKITEKQYNNREFVVGKQSSNVVNSGDRLVVL